MGLVDLIPALGAVPIIGILRRCPPDRVLDLATLASECGLTTLEITLDSEDALGQIEQVAEKVSALTVGAGTVMTVDDVDAAQSAGARFVVTPVTDHSVVAECFDRGMAVLPGAATPTEIWSAHRAGATAVKVFPARQLGGPAYVAALRQPLGEVDLVPTGGIAPGDVSAYLSSGAAAVALGASLFPPGLIIDGTHAGIADLIGQAVEAAT